VRPVVLAPLALRDALRDTRSPSPPGTNIVHSQLTQQAPLCCRKLCSSPRQASPNEQMGFVQRGPEFPGAAIPDGGVEAPESLGALNTNSSLRVFSLRSELASLAFL
jgi:hypothetical protein